MHVPLSSEVITPSIIRAIKISPVDLITQPLTPKRSSRIDAEPESSERMMQGARIADHIAAGDCDETRKELDRKGSLSMHRLTSISLVGHLTLECELQSLPHLLDRRWPWVRAQAGDVMVKAAKGKNEE